MGAGETTGRELTSLEAGTDFFLPLVNRKWLMLLDEDAVSGFRIRPNLSLPEVELGFSFSSNSLGLRGPASVCASKVLFGTSFAMGFAVNDGDNWWESALDNNWINLSLPIGVNRIRRLYEATCRGEKRLAVVLYHPNFWQFAKQYQAQITSGKTVREFFGWQTDEEFCGLLQQKLLKLREAKVRNGQAIAFLDGGIPHYMETDIYRFDFEREGESVSQAMEHWCDVLGKFERVVVIRALMKQELCPAQHRNARLEATCAEFDRGWEVFLSHLAARIAKMDAHVADSMRYEHFYPAEGHWTARGNKEFAAWFSNLRL